MKALHYSALAPLSVARALSGRANETLSPFLSYLKQAVKTAKERQGRLCLTWEKVRWRQKLHLLPRDTVVVAMARPRRLLVRNWPAGRTVDGTKSLILTNRGEDVVKVPVSDHQSTESGLVIQPAQTIFDDEEVYFDKLPLDYHLIADPEPPLEVFDRNGVHFPIRRNEADGAGRRLVVDGRPQGELHWGAGANELERRPEVDGLSLLKDNTGRELAYDGVKELSIEVEDLPADDVLEGNNGVRFDWKLVEPGGERQGHWIQLLESDAADDELALDPRLFFCEDNVDEVWTQPRFSKETSFKVKRVSRERYRLLLERLPPEGSELYLPKTWQNIERQRSAVFQLKDQPLPHHRGLLRITEDPQQLRRAPVIPHPVGRWWVLTDETRDGTDEQRAFVEIALGTPDLAFLEGPPGSGKTTAICELILQLAAEGKRVLLCGSTHFAIDNVLERLVVEPKVDWPAIEAVRIGRVERVDDKVRRCQIDEKVNALAECFREVPEWRRLAEEDRRKMAERIVLLSANLTCGTTMGILQHPFLRGERNETIDFRDAVPPTFPHWDVLIVDEASKTTLQEFLVPALLARRWIVVGDVRQLPPFTERGDLEANLESLVDPWEDKERQLFAPEHQRACLYAVRLRQFRESGMRWLVVDEMSVLRHLRAELTLESKDWSCVVVNDSGVRNTSKASDELSLDALIAGDPTALLLRAAAVVMVPRDLFDKVEPHVPGDLLRMTPRTGPEPTSWDYRHGHSLQRAPRLQRPVRDRKEEITTASHLEQVQQKFFSERTWAKEVAWRLARIHELKHGSAKDERGRLMTQRDKLLPASGEAKKVRDRVLEIQDIGLRSMLETLKEGVGEERVRRSCLTDGLPSYEWNERAIPLSYQHRMHPEISKFPRENFYEEAQLLDANTIAGREARRGWSFGEELPARRLWLHVKGDDRDGRNEAEVERMMAELRRFAQWARSHPRSDEQKPWEVACLTFYVRQEKAIREALRKWTHQMDNHTRFSQPNVDIVCGTVDRFQGREADLVFLLMRNVHRIGFLDSPNRLNVAVTRARFLLGIVGNRSYFERNHRVAELETLARDTLEWPEPARVGRTR